MKSISISIIIPMYNVKQYISECLNSIITQITETDEVIIIDDGSTDNSYEICNEIIYKKKNIKLIRQENKGPGAARNLGIFIAKGDYILFVDSDDMLKVNMLKGLKTIVSNDLIDIVYFGSDIISENKLFPKVNRYKRESKTFNKVLSGKEMFSLMYQKSYMSSVCLSLIRKKYLEIEHIRFSEGVFHEDIEFTFKALIQAERVICIPERYYLRRYRENSIMTSGMSYKRWIGMLSVSIKIWDYLKNILENQVVDDEFLNSSAAYIFKLLKNVIDESKYHYFVESEYSVELILKKFLSIWDIYYRTVGDTFIKIKGSLYIISLIDEYSIENISEVYSCFDYEKITKKYKEYITEKLCKLPFSDMRKRVGIYGIGKHTKDLLKQYKNWIGTIECIYLFIDSFASSGDIYLDKPIISLEQAVSNVDIIVISSFLYQEEMSNNIDIKIGREFPRICLYDQRDKIEYFG